MHKRVTLHFIFVSTKYQLVDIFTKPLSEEQFVDIRRQLGVISL